MFLILTGVLPPTDTYLTHRVDIPTSNLSNREVGVHRMQRILLAHNCVAQGSFMSKFLIKKFTTVWESIQPG